MYILHYVQFLAASAAPGKKAASKDKTPVKSSAAKSPLTSPRGKSPAPSPLTSPRVPVPYTRNPKPETLIYSNFDVTSPRARACRPATPPYIPDP